MAQKFEKQVVSKVEGFAKTHNGVKGLTIKGKFFSMEEIFDEVKDGDNIKVAINSDLAVDGGTALEEDYEEDED